MPVKQIPAIADDIAALQRMLLPREVPQIPGYQIAVHYLPCEAAGGDFYGWEITNGNTMGLGIADIAGHGLRAAVVMAMLRTWIAAFKYFNRPAGAISKDLNNFFAAIGDLKTFVTMVILEFNLKTGEFSLRNCGHPSPKLRRRDGTVQTLDQGRGLPLGIVFDEPPVPEATGKLQPGESLILYTDGITESAAADGSFFEEQRLDAAISGVGDTAEIILRSILDRLAAHRGGHRQRDDECLLVISRDL